MALLEAKNISKIYTTDNNVSVGLDKINLMLDKNEIVAITGSSGSGKSTLLRVLGGLDSYEEGELYFNENPTSHYSQQDWEDYLNDNISFIFQEYNILDSFTVLQNVEFALTDIKDLKKRKQRALDIIEEVGLKDRALAKGSKLSGGEKQRTVIARAIAKDAPIILADEPTGNLDSNTANDIIDLLKAISKDKLVVIVTHNYEDIKRISTRHIRLYDGKIESDDADNKNKKSAITQDKFDFSAERQYIFKSNKKKKSKGGNALDGIMLGALKCFSRPKQNMLIALLLIIASILIFTTCVMLIPSTIDDGNIIKQPGRILVVSKDGTNFTPEDTIALQTQLNANNSLYFDSAIDRPFYEGFSMPASDKIDKATKFKLGYDLKFHIKEGREVENKGEVTLKVPYTLKGKYKVGEEINLVGTYSDALYSGIYTAEDSNSVTFKSKIVGISYYIGSKTVYVDMHIKDIQAVAIRLRASVKSTIVLDYAEDSTFIEVADIKVDNDLAKDQVRVTGTYEMFINKPVIEVYYGFNRDITTTNLEKLNLKLDGVVYEQYVDTSFGSVSNTQIYVSKEFFDEVIIPRAEKELSSTQISLYFNSLDEAKVANAYFENEGASKYLTYMANDYKVEKPKVGASLIVSIIVAIVISLVIVLSLVKIVGSTKTDVSIYRTMGISDKVIKGSTYMQILLDVIPAIIVSFIAYVICFFTRIGGSVNFMPISWMFLLCLAVLLMGAMVAVGFNRVIYKQKINKSLRRTNK